MFRDLGCTIPSTTPFQKSGNSFRFIQTILEEERRVVELRHKDHKASLEDPKVRDENILSSLSAGLYAHKNEMFREAKRRQRLRENSQDLRLLQIQLRCAHVCQQLDAQKQENAETELNELAVKRQQNAEFAIEREQIQEERLQEYLQQQHKKAVLREQLQSQMAEKSVLRQQSIDQVKRDRIAMHALMQSYEDERQAELRKTEQFKQTSRKNMEEFVRNCTALRKKKNVNDNDGKMEELFIRQRDEFRQKRLDERRKRGAEKEELSHKIGRQLIEIEAEKRDRENSLLDLLIKERYANEQRRDLENWRKEIDQRLQMRTDFENYSKEMELVEEYRKEEEKRSMQAVAAQLNAENLKREKNEQDVRTKMEKYKKGLCAIIKDRQQERDFVAHQLKLDYENSLKTACREQRDINAERYLLLKDEKAELLKYLPPGVLTEADKMQLGIPVEHAPVVATTKINK